MRSTFQTVQVLSVFMGSLRERRTGYDIASATKLASGTLYPILARLEAHGVLRSEWEDVDPAEVGRPRRRYYWLTPEGMVYAQQQIEALNLPKVWAPGLGGLGHAL